jgi:hypothetical protein
MGSLGERAFVFGFVSGFVEPSRFHVLRDAGPVPLGSIATVYNSSQSCNCDFGGIVIVYAMV